MLRTAPSIRPSVYLLADHLDVVLACGEDLRAVAPLEGASQRVAAAADIYLAADQRRRFVEEVRTVEVRLVAHVLKARDHAEDVRRHHVAFRAVADLFISGTGIVADAAADLADTTGTDFQTGDTSTSYLRSRAMIAPDQAAPALGSPVVVRDSFLVAGALPLGALLDLVAAFLDALDAAFELYGPSVAAAGGTAASGQVPAETAGAIRAGPEAGAAVAPAVSGSPSPVVPSATVPPEPARPSAGAA